MGCCSQQSQRCFVRRCYFSWKRYVSAFRPTQPAHSVRIIFFCSSNQLKISNWNGAQNCWSSYVRCYSVASSHSSGSQQSAAVALDPEFCSQILHLSANVCRQCRNRRGFGTDGFCARHFRMLRGRSNGFPSNQQHSDDSSSNVSP